MLRFDTEATHAHSADISLPSPTLARTSLQSDMGGQESKANAAPVSSEHLYPEHVERLTALVVALAPAPTPTPPRLTRTAFAVRLALYHHVRMTFMNVCSNRCRCPPSCKTLSPASTSPYPATLRRLRRVRRRRKKADLI